MFNHPTPRQTMLLRAALLQDAAAVQAWHAWRVDADLDQLAPGTFALLPRLYHNLQHQGIADPWLVKCQGIYRRTWSQNQLLLQQVTLMLHACKRAGIQPLLVGDTALLLAHYTDYGLRMLSQVDMAIPSAQTAHMVALLQEAGWQPQITPQRRRSSPRENGQPYGFRYQQPDSKVIVHWYTMPSSGYPLGTESLWQGSTLVLVNQVETYALSPADLLLSICTGDQYRHPIQWIPDAMMVLQGSVPIDWTVLLCRVEEQALTLRLRQALTYLHDFWQAPIPMAVLQDLAKMPIQPFEIHEAQSYWHLPDTAAKLVAVWTEYQRRKRWHKQTALADHTGSLAQYLQERFDVASPWQLPLHLGKVLVRRFPWSARPI